MKTKRLTFLATALTLFVLTVIGSFVMSRSATAQKDIQPQNLVAQTKTINFVQSERKVNQDIPDKVAYELFLRTVGEYNAKGLLEKAGFSENEVEIIVGEAKSLNESLVLNDEAARKIREGGNTPSSSDYKGELAKIQTKEDELIDQTVNDRLSRNLNVEGFGKLKNFINSEIKNNITVVDKADFADDKSASVKTPVEDSTQNRGRIFLYSAAWQDGMNIFGSGTLSEQYQSPTSYHVTTTVTSPSGRSNTTSGDWSSATLSNNTGLSVGAEDGTFTTQSSFEQAEGYYDEYGNFVGTGSIGVGNASNSFLVNPFVRVESVTPATASLGTGSPTGLTSQTFTANITVTPGVPPGTDITVGFAETVKTGGANFTYSVTPSNRLRVITVTTPGVSRTATFTVQVGQSSLSGGATNQGTIELVTNGVEISRNNDAKASFTYTTGSTSGGGGPPGGYGTCYPNTGGGGAYGCMPGYGTVNTVYCCQYSSPLLLDIDGDGYAMTDYYEGVPFDVNGDGSAGQTSWTAANSDDAWIVLDRNENNRIDSGLEMFGDASEQDAAQNPRNGFASLAVFDTAARGGNADGKITRRDAVFRKLRLWQDRNHNGISEPEELSRLPALDVVAVFLNYQPSNRTDQYGNRFKFRAKVRDRNDARVGRWAWDVFLVISPPGSGSRSACLLRK